MNKNIIIIGVLAILLGGYYFMTHPAEEGAPLVESFISNTEESILQVESKKLQGIVAARDKEKCSDMDAHTQTCERLIDSYTSLDTALETNNENNCNSVENPTLQVYCYDEMRLKNTIAESMELHSVAPCINIAKIGIRQVCKNYVQALLEIQSSEDTTACDSLPGKFQQEACKEYAAKL